MSEERASATADVDQRGRAPLRERLRLALIVGLGQLVIRLLGATWRVRLVNDEALESLKREQQPFVWAFWHGQILPLLWWHRGQRAAILISSHRDGEIVARIAEGFGYRTIRGSTSRGAARALLAMVRELEHGPVAVTPDGPRGPVEKFAPGALVAAQRAGAPILALGVSASRSWRLKSWDRFMIPKPFARVTIAYEDRAFVAADSARGAELEAPRFEQLLNQARARAGA